MMKILIIAFLTMIMILIGCVFIGVFCKYLGLPMIIAYILAMLYGWFIGKKLATFLNKSAKDGR